MKASLNGSWKVGAAVYVQRLACEVPPLEPAKVSHGHGDIFGGASAPQQIATACMVGGTMG